MGNPWCEGGPGWREQADAGWMREIALGEQSVPALLRVFQLKSYPIELPPVGRNDITPVMLSAAKRSRNIPHSDWTIIFPDYS
jgi:hypothetical protein